MLLLYSLAHLLEQFWLCCEAGQAFKQGWNIFCLAGKSGLQQIGDVILLLTRQRFINDKRQVLGNRFRSRNTAWFRNHHISHRHIFMHVIDVSFNMHVERHLLAPMLKLTLKLVVAAAHDDDLQVFGPSGRFHSVQYRRIQQAAAASHKKDS